VLVLDVVVTGATIVANAVAAVGVRPPAREHRYVFITLGYLALAVASLVFAAVR